MVLAQTRTTPPAGTKGFLPAGGEALSSTTSS